LGPAGGLPKNIAPRNVPAAVSKVSLIECFNETFKVEIDGKPLAILDAAPLRTQSAAGDILAFWTSPDPRLAPRPLAERAPNKDEPVWLAAQLVQGAPRTRRLHRGAAVGTDEDGDFIFKFENAAISLRATSGAPVLNAAGEVVAINLGAGRKDGQMIGIANPVDRFRKFLEAAAKSSE
jgi:S1-C subfamily serine protease